MTDKLFDEFVKSKLEQYDSGAPMNVWERIKKDKDDDPKGIFFWWNKKHWILLSVLLIASSTGFLLLKKESVSLAKTITSKKDVANTSVNHQSSSNKTSSLTQTEINSNEQKSRQNINDNSATLASSSNVQLNNEEPGDDDQIAPVASKEPNVASVQNNKPDEFSYSNAKRKTLIQKHSTINKNALFNINSDIKEDFENKQTANKQNTSVTQPQLTLAGYFQKSNLQQFKLGNIAMPQNKPSCPTINGPRRKDLYLEIYAGPDYNVRTLTTTAAPAGYVRERNENENYRTSFSAGLRLVKNLGEKTLIKTGINYSQINERLKLVAENSKQQTQIITIRTVVRAPGDTLFVRDTMYYEQNGTRYRTTYNRYRFIDVPVLFSYEFGNPDLLHFAVNAGAVFNIASFYGGEVLDTTFRPVKISTNTGSNANNWRSNIGVGVFASVAMYKKLNDRMHLFAEPYMRYNLNPVTQQNSFIKQRYLITGMQLGVRYNFIKPGQRYR